MASSIALRSPKATGACSANDKVRATSVVSSRALFCCNHRPDPSTADRHSSVVMAPHNAMSSDNRRRNGSA